MQGQTFVGIQKGIKEMQEPDDGELSFSDEDENPDAAQDQEAHAVRGPNRDNSDELETTPGNKDRCHVLCTWKARLTARRDLHQLPLARNHPYTLSGMVWMHLIDILFPHFLAAHGCGSVEEAAAEGEEIGVDIPRRPQINSSPPHHYTCSTTNAPHITSLPVRRQLFLLRSERNALTPHLDSKGR